jgi:heptosyltransferase-2
LRSSYPQAQIDFLVKSQFAELVEFNPHLSSVIELKTGENEELRALRKKIHNKHYDVILDIHNNLRSKYIRLFSGARIIRVVNKIVLRRFLLVNFKFNFYGQEVPVAERYLRTAKVLGVADDKKGLEIFVPEEIQTEIRVKLSKFKIDTFPFVIGLAPTAKHFTKRWPQERFVELGAYLAKERSAKILIFGGKDDAEYCGDIAQMINSLRTSNRAESLAGSLTLLETAAALDACQLVVTNDSGMMHFAAARKRKVVAIFGSTVKEFGFFPYGTEYVVVEQQGLDCRPCSHIGREKCPKGHFRCMKDTDVESVLDAVNSLLGVHR